MFAYLHVTKLRFYAHAQKYKLLLHCVESTRENIYICAYGSSNNTYPVTGDVSKYLSRLKTCVKQMLMVTQNFMVQTSKHV